MFDEIHPVGLPGGCQGTVILLELLDSREPVFGPMGRAIFSEKHGILSNVIRLVREIDRQAVTARTILPTRSIFDNALVVLSRECVPHLLAGVR